MTPSAARDKVKTYLDLKNVSDFDSDIDTFVLSGVDRLYPLAQKEVEAQVVTVTDFVNGRASINLSTLTTPLDGVRNVETGDGYEPVDTYHHGKTLYLLDVPSYANDVILYGLARFKLTDVAPEFQLAVVYFAAAEFYKMLSGNKRKYNLFMASARSAVENMQDLVDYYEGLANQHLADRITIYGAS